MAGAITLLTATAANRNFLNGVLFIVFPDLLSGTGQEARPSRRTFALPA
jgi:hypothetical protein